MSKRVYNLESARKRLEDNGIQVQGTAIFTSDKRPMGISLLGAADYLCSEMGFRINPTDVKQQKFNRKKKESE